MPAIVVAEPGRLDLRSSPPDSPLQPHEVRIHVERAGICGSDIHILHGSNPFARYPRIIGHEFAGRVSAVGSDVSTLAVGTRVVVDPVIACGTCYACRIGRHNVCGHLQVIGVHRDGGFQDYAVVPALNCVAIPDGITIEEATLAEPFAVAANVLSRTGISADDSVLIYGAGTVGLTVLQVAKLHGARCLVSDPDEARLERARHFGADVTINPMRDAVPDVVRHELDGLGPSLVIDGAGIPALADEACRVASPAGRIGLLGFSPAPCNVSQQEIVRKELTIVGSRLNKGFLPQSLAWMAEGKLNAKAMITQVFAADEARAAFELIERDPASTIKVHLTF